MSSNSGSEGSSQHSPKSRVVFADDSTCSAEFRLRNAIVGNWPAAPFPSDGAPGSGLNHAWGKFDRTDDLVIFSAHQCDSSEVISVGHDNVGIG
jgi:hypothetical protein